VIGDVFSRRRHGRRRAVVVALLAGALAASSGCAGRFNGARTLAALGTVLVGSGSTIWVVGEKSDQNGMATAGFTVAAAGLAAIAASGGWMARAVACNADPDCDDNEQCREIPAPPGGIPYKQCTAR
jgi:type IV secretory pathway TrbL component